MAYGDQVDLDFCDFVPPPYGSFEAALVNCYGWGENDANTQMELLQLAVAGIYRHFGGSEDAQPLLLFPEEDIVGEAERIVGNQVYVSGFAEEVSTIALKYLTGEGDDYEYMKDLLQFR